MDAREEGREGERGRGKRMKRGDEGGGGGGEGHGPHQSLLSLNLNTMGFTMGFSSPSLCPCMRRKDGYRILCMIHSAFMEAHAYRHASSGLGDLACRG